MKVTLSGDRPTWVRVEYERPSEKQLGYVRGRCTTIIVDFLNEQNQPVQSIFGASYCHPKDNFSKVRGKVYALQNLFKYDEALSKQSERIRLFSKEDRQLLYKKLCSAYFKGKNHNLISKLKEVSSLVKNNSEDKALSLYVQKELDSVIRKLS